MGVTQQALVWSGNHVRLATRTLLAPGPFEVVLKLTSVGLCSSDFHIWSGRKSGEHGILGHEGAGEVIDVGPGIVDWRLGDRVIVNPLLNCGTCVDCLSDRGHVCPSRQIIGYNGAGLMATVQVLSSRSLLRHPPSLPLSHGCLVEPLACVVHAQRALERTTPESSMLVLGCGPMGALHTAYARQRGVGRILVTDPVEHKLALARSRGIAADAWIPLRDLRNKVRDLTDGRGVDVAVISTSARAGRELAFELTADEGQVLAFASILDRPGSIALPDGPFDSDEVHRKEDRVAVRTRAGMVTVVGAIGFDQSSFLESARLLGGLIDGEQFVTARVGFESVPGLVGGEWQRHLKITIEPSQTGETWQ
jgi:threonine dehydrogenase-like Zn-dependent dehydrogenase